MLRRLIALLHRSQPDAIPLVRTLPQPLTLAGREFRINMEAIERLEHLRTLGHYYREQMDAAANECVYLLGLDPESSDCPCEVAREIVLNGVRVHDAVAHINCILDAREERKRADF